LHVLLFDPSCCSSCAYYDSIFFFALFICWLPCMCSGESRLTSVFSGLKKATFFCSVDLDVLLSLPCFFLLFCFISRVLLEPERRCRSLSPICQKSCNNLIPFFCLFLFSVFFLLGFVLCSFASSSNSVPTSAYSYCLSHLLSYSYSFFSFFWLSPFLCILSL
jgi:hypothetical protein